MARMLVVAEFFDRLAIRNRRYGGPVLPTTVNPLRSWTRWLMARVALTPAHGAFARIPKDHS